MNRKRLLLVVLLGGLLLSLLYAYLATPRLEKAPPREAARKSRGAVAEGAVEYGGVRVRLEALTGDRTPFPGARRDIFRFREKPVLPAPPPPVKVEAPPEPVVVIPPQPVLPTPAEELQAALSRFTFLGFLAKGGERTVFLSSGGELFLVKAGERFGKEMEFLVTGIEGQTLEVQRTGQGGLIRIPLVESEALRPAVSTPARRPSLALPETSEPDTETSEPTGDEASLPDAVSPDTMVPVGRPVQNLQNIFQGGADGTNQ